MGYIAEIVESGKVLAEPVSPLVEKIRGYERIDALVDLASQHGPDVVKKLDEKVDQALGEVCERKDKAMECLDGAKESLEQRKSAALEHYNGAKELLEQTKVDVSGHYTGAVELVQRKKSAALGLVQKKKDGMLEFVQETKGNVQSVGKERLPRAVQQRLSEVEVQVALVMTIIVAQYRGVLDLPLSLKRRVEKGLPVLQQQCSASLGPVKSWAMQKLEQAPQVLEGVEMAKTWAKAFVSDPTGQLREAAQAAKLLVQAKADSVLEQLPSYRERASEGVEMAKTWAKAFVSDPSSSSYERASEAARDATAWVKSLKTRVPTKQT